MKNILLLITLALISIATLTACETKESRLNKLNNLDKKATTLKLEGKHDEAINIYTEMIELFPARPETFSAMAESYIAKKDYDNAIKKYKKIPALPIKDPKYTLDAYINMAKTYEAQENYEEALSYFKQAYQVDMQIDGSRKEEIKEHIRRLSVME